MTTCGNIYKTYIRPVLLYGSECWAPFASDILKLQRNDHAMLRWIFGTSLKNRESELSILNRLGIDDLETTIGYDHPHWFGHIQRSTSPLNEITNFVLDGCDGRGRPRKTWSECIKSDISKFKMSQIDPNDRLLWR